MRKHIIILSAAVFAFLACQKHEIELLDKPIITELDGNKVSYTFTAVISDEVSEVEEDGTKATMSRAGAFTWVVGDKLKFFPSVGEAADAEVTAVAGSTATITVTTSNPRSSFVSAIYPADAAVAKNQITFDARGPIVVAEVIDGGTLTFHHVGSLINLKFTGISENNDIKSLVFTPSSAFTYNGTFTFSDHKPTLTATGSTARIVVPASKADNNSDITVCVPSVILSGFSAALNNNVNGNGRNLFMKSTATAHDLSEDSPVLMNMQKVAYEASSKYYVTTKSSTKYWDKTNVRMIQSEANKYETWMNCDGGSDIYIYDEYNIDNYLTGSLKTGSVGDGKLYQIYYNTSSELGGPVYKGETSDKPFYNGDFPTSDFCLMGTFNEWGTSDKFTYNGNLNWSLEDLTIDADGTYDFGVRKASAEGFWAGANTLTSLYGSIKGNGNAHITLSAGTYNVYLCPTTDWNYLIMFEKQ